MVFDRMYAQDVHRGKTLRKMWKSLEPLFAAGVFSGERILLTNDAEVNPGTFFQTMHRVDSFRELLESAEKISVERPGGFLWCHARRWDMKTLDAEIGKLNVSALLSVRGAALSKNAKKASTPEEIRLNLLHHLEIQLPWWIRFPQVAAVGTSAATYTATRNQSLLAAEDLGKILLAEDPKSVSRDAIFINDAPRHAVVTEEWFLTWDERLDTEREFPGELYRKPDDWWEQNNVASRCPEEMETLYGLRVCL